MRNLVGSPRYDSSVTAPLLSPTAATAGPEQVDLCGDTLGTHQDRKQPELANTGKR